MSGSSIASYYPWCRMRVSYHHVTQPSQTALVKLEPDQRFRPLCHACGQPAGPVHSHGRKFVRDMSFGDYSMVLQVEYRKVWCDACGGVRMEQLDFVDVHQRLTRRLADYAAQLCQLGLSVEAVARHLNLDPKTVKACDLAALRQDFAETSYQGLQRLAVDEIAVRKGHTYMTVVLDFDSGRVVWLGQGRQIATLDVFFKNMPESVRQGIQAVALDMWEPYIQSIRRWCPQAEIVFDLFHVVKAFNKVIDAVRNQEFRKAEPAGRKALKGSKYLFLKTWGHLKRGERRRLDEILWMNRRLNTVYWLKDFLVHIWSYRRPGWAEWALEEWCAVAEEDGHRALRGFAQMLQRHRHGIIAHCKHAIHTSRLEGVNNKIKLIKRAAFGFHDLDYFALKVKQAFPGTISYN